MTGSNKLQLGVLLDRDTIDAGGDIDFAVLESIFSQWRAHDYTLSDDVVERIDGASVIISNKVMLDENALRSVPGLKLVCIAATGTNNVDLEAAKALGIPVCNVRGYATPTVSQHALALILALSTRLIDYHQAVRSGRWQQARQFCLLDYPIRELAGKTLGIVGYGELGQAVARLGEALGMKLLIAQRPGGSAQPGRTPLDELLPQVDVLSLHCPLTPETQNLIGAPEFALMKRDAILINTARGGIVDEQALADNGNVLLDPDIPNLIVTPHSAWASRETRQRLVDELVTNIYAFLQGSVRNPVA
jgi:glycerate dehydrogenase